MAYTSRGAIVAKLPDRYVVEALDDDGDGEEDAGLLDTIIATGDTEIDGYLEGRYQLPLSPTPAKLATASLVIALEAIYYRRGLSREDNPWANRASEIRASLRRIQAGEENLFAGTEKAEAGVVVVAEPARTHSNSNRLLA